MTTDSPHADENASHRLRKVLGLRDLIPMQILIVLGPSWTGTAAHQAGTQVSFWILGTVLLFLPVAAVVQYCVQIWPYEGGVYQWTKHAFGPFAGFLSAWNLGAWVLLIVATLGVQTASGVRYALGPRAAWIAEDRAVISGLNICLFAGILLVCIPGLRIGRCVRILAHTRCSTIPKHWGINHAAIVGDCAVRSGGIPFHSRCRQRIRFAR